MIRFSTIILNGDLFGLLLFASAFAQVPQFQREVDTIPVTISGSPVPKPFTGGYSFSKPTFADIDNDGDFDLFVGEGGGRIFFYRNTGTASNSSFTLDTENFASINVGGSSTPTFPDIDNDGDSDFFVGESEGGLYFYRNVTPNSVSSREAEGSPHTFELSQNYPNPFNPETNIQYQLPKTSQVRLVIYNLVGHRVATLVNKNQQAGFYSVQWNGRDDSGRIVTSGVYLYRLETKEFVKVRKLTLIR